MLARQAANNLSPGPISRIFYSSPALADCRRTMVGGVGRVPCRSGKRIRTGTPAVAGAWMGQAVAFTGFLPAMKAPKRLVMKGTTSMTMVVAMKGTRTRLRCHISQPVVSGIRM